MGLPTLDTPLNEVSGPVHQFDETLEEIRAICRLHACPTGRWEDLIDLPLRISQDAGLRFDFIAIVHTLQRNRFNLPDVLDLLVLAIGGASAPRHSHQLGEQLNLLGGFLTGIGHWPSTDFEPILAPGEVPADLAKFTRPQARERHAAEAPTTPSSQPLSSRPQRSEVDGPASPLPQPQPGATNPQSNLSSRPERSAAEGPAFPPISPPVIPAAVEGPASLPATAPPHPYVPETKPAEISAITNALARLERGNLELRAHLDSIDQRIGRMEPRLELSSPPADLAPEADPSPVLLHRGTSGRDTMQTAPLHTEPLHPDPLHTTPISSPSLHAQPLRSEAPQSVPTRPISIREDRREAREVREESRRHEHSRHNEADRIPSGERTVNTPAWAGVAETHTGATSPRQRFSRFSRDPISPDLDPPSVPEPAPPAAITVLPVSPEASALKPGTLPRGFFGTVPEPDSEDPAAEIEPRSHRKRFGLFFTVLLLLGLIGAATFIYRHNIATESDTAANSGDVTPVAAPRPTTGSTISSHGPLTATPTRPTAGQPAPSTGNRVLGARSAFHPSQSTEEPHSAGFRPAGTFVPASVMEGRLLSAPIPQQARTTSASSGNGLVVMEANISGTGQVEDLHVLGGSSALRIPAIEAVRNWRYRPYLLNGSPVEVRTIVRVDLNQHQSQPAERGAPFPP